MTLPKLICPLANRCDHLWPVEKDETKPCGHHIPHQENGACEAPACKEFIHTGCIVYKEDEPHYRRIVL